MEAELATLRFGQDYDATDSEVPCMASASSLG